MPMLERRITVYRRRRSRGDIEKRIRGLQLQLIKLEFEMGQNHGNDMLKSQFLNTTCEIKLLSWVLMEDE